MKSHLDPSIESLCCHAGAGQGDGVPLAHPLVQSTTFCQGGVGGTAPYTYSRVANPTVSALEATLGRLEDAPPAVCFSTGLAAECALFLAVLKAGDHLVCGRSVYGGTTRLIREFLAPLGVACTFVDATCAADVAAAIRPDTRLVFVETPANPTLVLTDLRAVAAITRAAGVPLAVDNTFLTPVLQQPLELGADISVCSTTKFIDGHSVAPGGALVTRDEALLERLRFVRKATGAIQTPLHAWLTLQGIKTLPLRIRRQSATALAVARALAERPGIARVHYPTFADADLAAAQHRGAHGAVVTIELAGGLAAAARFCESLRLARLVEHVGSVETLATHPATMTHASVPEADRRAVGITDGLVRLSIGLEEPDEILADLDGALGALQGEAIATEGSRS
ncbi:MAG TPA: aminotransferase class I/II-fold pyridoxal phosphate-dependent enzyme [Candidatus Krumholzibacteria bacterium]|nr:aminotransferase class I/II-fold pyridoxal phosphate-dependent enzyme [Candidatus Krumholzibacteria bacterium]